jgi:hypothetical protein
MMRMQNIVWDYAGKKANTMQAAKEAGTARTAPPLLSPSDNFYPQVD